MKFRLTCFLLLLMLGWLSCFPAFADDLDDDAPNDDHTPTYHVFDDVDLISTMKFSYDKHRIVIKSVYPQLTNDRLDENIDHFNQLINDSIKSAITQFKDSVYANLAVQNNLPKSMVKNDLYIDYDTSLIKSKEYNLISIRLSMQGFIAGMAHPYHYHQVLNYNLDTGEEMELSDLFEPESDYLNTVATYVRSVLSKRLGNQTMIMAGTAPNLKNYRNWNIKPTGLVITFDEYQVAPYTNGAQTVLVPYMILKPFISMDSPIYYCVTHAKKCGTNSILTGGFIDEAINTRHRSLNPLLSQR